MTDRSGFDEFVHARGPALARTAYLLTGDHHLAEDLVQAALVQAARHWERIETSPEAYVRRTMYHQNISWWRRRKLAETPLQSYDAPVPATDPTVRLTLEQALRRLTPRQRTVLVLRYFEDLTEVRTAAELGISSGAVKSMSRQALATPARPGPRARRPGGSRRMSTDLREELDALARTQTFSPDPSAWDRGRRARRRTRLAAGMAAVAVVAVVAGAGALALRRTARPYGVGEVVEGGAIPSRIEDPGGPRARPTSRSGAGRWPSSRPRSGARGGHGGRRGGAPAPTSRAGARATGLRRALARARRPTAGASRARPADDRARRTAAVSSLVPRGRPDHGETTS